VVKVIIIIIIIIISNVPRFREPVKPRMMTVSPVRIPETGFGFDKRIAFQERPTVVVSNRLGSARVRGHIVSTVGATALFDGVMIDSE